MNKTLAKLSGLAISLAVPGIALAQFNQSGSDILSNLRTLLFPVPVSGNFDIGVLFTQILNVVILIAAIIAILYLIWAGIQYITASTDEEKAKKARTAIYNAIIGIVVIILSYAIIVFVGRIVRQNVPGSGETTGTGGLGGFGGFNRLGGQ